MCIARLEVFGFFESTKAGLQRIAVTLRSVVHIQRLVIGFDRLTPEQGGVMGSNLRIDLMDNLESASRVEIVSE